MHELTCSYIAAGTRPDHRPIRSHLSVLLPPLRPPPMLEATATLESSRAGAMRPRLHLGTWPERSEWCTRPRTAAGASCAPTAGAPPMMSLSPSPVASPQPPGRRRILLVEADPAAQEVLREQLHGMGHPVIVAAGLAEATSLLATLHVDLVLADALLAGVDAPLDARWAALVRLRAL